MTAMGIKHRTKRNTRCCMDLANRHQMLPATKYHINPLSTTYVDLDAMPVDPFAKFNTTRACWPKVNALHDGRLHTRYKDVVEDMESRIPQGESPMRSHLRHRKKCTHLMSASKQ